jgi:hypothetical protein
MRVRSLNSGIAGVVVGIVGTLSAQQPPNIDYAALKPCQTARFLTTGQKGWTSLDDSQRLQFAGGTQSLNTIATASSPCNSLTEISSSRTIFGSISDAPSAAQFHIDVKWTPEAEQVFAGIKGWKPHLAWLHPGQHGFQENRNGNSFLGIVVLFDDDHKTMGQFHVGLGMPCIVLQRSMINIRGIYETSGGRKSQYLFTSSLTMQLAAKSTLRISSLLNDSRRKRRNHDSQSSSIVTARPSPNQKPMRLSLPRCSLSKKNCVQT